MRRGWNHPSRCRPGRSTARTGPFRTAWRAWMRGDCNHRQMIVECHGSVLLYTIRRESRYAERHRGRHLLAKHSPSLTEAVMKRLVARCDDRIVIMHRDEPGIEEAVAR